MKRQRDNQRSDDQNEKRYLSLKQEWEHVIYLERQGKFLTFNGHIAGDPGEYSFSLGRKRPFTSGSSG
jgi:hypothetical protein